MALDDSTLKVLSDLKRKRGVVKASLTRIITFVNRFDPVEQAVSLLEFRQEELPQINRRFDVIQCEIELLAVDDAQGSEQERENFEVDYYSVRSRIQELINADRPSSTTSQNASFGNNTSNSHMQLAPIPLPNFNGNIQDWTSFYDVFKGLVHNDGSIPPAQKFYWLRSCLSGQALDLIKAIPISDGNYEAVIQRLIHRYDNKSLIIQSHIRSILDSPRVEEASANSLRVLHSHVCAHVAALRAIEQPVEHWDAWLVTIIISRLDKNTAHGWQLHQRNTELPKYEQLEEFLAGRCIALESTEARMQGMGNPTHDSKNSEPSSRENRQSSNARKSLLIASNKTQRPCPCCTEAHKLFACETFKALKVNGRLDFVRSKGLCFNCFAPFHNADNCKSIYSCKKCSKKHNTLLHLERKSEMSGQKEDDLPHSSKEDSSPINTQRVSMPAQTTSNYVFLATAVVLVTDRYGVKRQCRAVLDSGSQINFVSKRFANLLNISREQTSVPISGIGANRTHSAASVTLKIESRVKKFQVILTCHVLPTIVEDFPSCPTGIEDWKIPEEYATHLADPSFHLSGSIDLLIGGGAFFDILDKDRVQLGFRSLSLQDTKLGWVVTGELGAICLMNVNSVGQSIEDGWLALENSKGDYGRLSNANKKCLEENEALRHFEKTARRDVDGRFVLRLPLKPEAANLGDTLKMATSRFLSVERRLQNDPALKESYVNFMEEYEKAGHMQEIVNRATPAAKVFYLPHHPVLKASSLTTKLRVVFDASAKSSTGVALNDVLMCGPTVQEELFCILVRFRIHQYVITADVEKMFRQVAVAVEDQDFQRIVWRATPSDTLRVYRLTTVTYGTTSASFMATKCLISLADTEKDRYPKASAAIERDFYMDDLLTGADTIEECITLQKQINAILDSAKLPLRKWCSNSPKILEGVNATENDPLFVIHVESDDVVKSLGLCWNPLRDDLVFQMLPTLNRLKVTKRVLLSDLNKIFDPLGFLTPVLIRGKIFIQQLWQLKVDWDKPLADDIKMKWERFHQQLKELESLSVSRKCKPFASELVELHGFCDASQEAYGACIYVRCKDLNGKWHVRLLCSKSRVAPLKGVTIPRLELNGALVLSQLASKVAFAWKREVKSFYLWTDSMVVLGWLNSHGSRLKTYVANRTEQILEVTDSKQWKHVQTKDNPADILSRGMSAGELRSSELWWNGPSWLAEDESGWKCSQAVLQNEQDLPEQRTIKLVLVGIEPSRDLIKIYSVWQRLLRATAWLAKFIEFLKGDNPKLIARYLTVVDLRKAETILIKRTQRDVFNEEYIALSKGLEVRRCSKLISLNPVMKDGLILVGGRLQNANICEAQKHPIVLPSGHKISNLIFKDHHRIRLHCGPQALLSSIRQRFWPLRGRIMARSVVLKCVGCIRAKPKIDVPFMAPMPIHRVLPSRPFATTGVDFAGPLIIRSGVRRLPGKKAWIAVFVCFSTRAIHLEAVEELTSSAFLASLRRFMARRGMCTHIYSDNGTNFVGAQKELTGCLKNVDRLLAIEGITWHFNPPSAPHFGGLWEAAVKGAKYHLTRVVKDTKLTLSELMTLLCQIEACVNSRPMTPLSSDPSDMEPLTPAHFLIGGPMHLHAEQDLTSLQPNGLMRWKYVQYLMQSFWVRWHKEYLPELQVRGKWLTKKKDLVIDDIVIIKDDCTPPTKWKLGRIMKVHPGIDGIVRVVTLRTATQTEIRRPVAKLCRLPTEAEVQVETHHFQRGEDVAAENGNNNFVN